MSELCKWLHENIEQLPLIKWPFKLEQLPENGIYFFYEDSEIWGHGGCKPRIVRIGTHKDGNFRSRISEHFLFDESKMNFDKDKPKPSDRSIFRKNIGRVLLNKDKDDYLYLKIWEIDFTTRTNRKKYGDLRDIQKEKRKELEITRILRENFSFRFIIVESQIERMGSKGLESSLIGTIARCKLCRPSNNWLGSHSPNKQIRERGLWLVKHLDASRINNEDKKIILNFIRGTKEWIKNGR
jgi:hypothetical protein